MLIPIFDAHLDLSYNALSWERDITQELHVLNSSESHMTDHPARGFATTCLPELRQAGVRVALATLLCRSPCEKQIPSNGRIRRDLDFAFADAAHAMAQGQLAYYRLLQRKGELRILKSAVELEQYWDHQSEATTKPIGIILAMEGADPISSPDEAQLWFEQGVRSVGLVHYAMGRYGPGTGCTGPLTTAGVELLREFEKLGMIVDMTHLSDEAFQQTIEIYNGPIIASHHNCRTLVPGQRQLTDQQILALIQKEAVIGIALDAWMLHPDWKIGKTNRSKVHLEAAVDHIDHICQLAGNIDHVGIGSDLDGGFGTEQCPTGLDSISDLQKLAGLLAHRGYNHNDIQSIFHKNWYRFFTQNLPATAVKENSQNSENCG